MSVLPENLNSLGYWDLIEVAARGGLSPADAEVLSSTLIETAQADLEAILTLQNAFALPTIRKFSKN